MALSGIRTASAAPNVSMAGLLNPYPTLAPNTGYGLLNPGTTTPADIYSAILGNTSSTSSSTPTVAAAQGLSAPQGKWTLPNGTTVNYSDLLKNDPLLQQQLAGIQASDAANQAALRASEQQGLIGYGSVPAGLANIPGLSGVIDQTTQDLANQNTASGLSTYAKLQNAYKQAVSGTNNNLAARGMLRSGAFGQESANNLLSYNQAQSTAVGQLNQYMAGLYNGYLGQQQSLQQQEYGAYNTALQNLIQEIMAGLIGGGNGGGGGGGGNGGGGGSPTAPTPGAIPAGYAPGPPGNFGGMVSRTGRLYYE